MTAYRYDELRRVVTRAHGRITLAGYRTAELRALADTAAAALADLAAALDAEHRAEPAALVLDLRTRLVERGP